MNLDNVSQNTVEEPNYETSTFTNIDLDDFEGCWGSTTVPTGEYNGDGIALMRKETTKYFIKSGDTKNFPAFLVDHFAVQLANKILLRETQDFADSPRKQDLIKQIKGTVKVAPVENARVIETPAFTQEEIQAELDNTTDEVFEGLEEVKEVVKKPRAKKVASAEVTE